MNSDQRRVMAARRRCAMSLVMFHASLVLTGCESLEKKFTRKPKTPPGRPAPVVNFRDYMAGVSPLDRYRKHYTIFQYWNDQLISELQERDMNPKRVQHASEEAGQEMRALGQLLQGDAAAELQPMIEQRARIDQQLRSLVAGAQTAGLVRTLDAQTRQFHRRFYWRQVQDRLNTQADASPH